MSILLFCHYFNTSNARKSIKGSKSLHFSIKSNTILSHKISLFDHRCRHKKTANLPQLWRHRPITPNPLVKCCFVFYTTRLPESAEGLKSSLAPSACELWLTKICPERPNYTFWETLKFLLKMGFMSHNFGSRCARKPINGSKDAE